VPFADGSRTELFATGAARRFTCRPLVVIDIGGQDAKVIRLDAQGLRLSHRMNRKCAAGTGSFLDEIALRLGIETAALDVLAAQATEELELSSFCTVFAGTELLMLIRAGRRPADLAMAAYRSLMKRVIAMDVFEGRVVATGGVVAHHPTMVALLTESLHTDVIVPPHPQEMGAFGAARRARWQCRGLAMRGGTRARWRRAPTMTREPSDTGRHAMSHALAAEREGDTIRSQLSPVGERESVGGLLARNVAVCSAVYSECRIARSAVSWEQFTAMGSFASCPPRRGTNAVAIVPPNRGEMLVAEFATMGPARCTCRSSPATRRSRCGLARHESTVVIAAGRELLDIQLGRRVLVTLSNVDEAAVATLLKGTRVSHAEFSVALAQGAGHGAGLAGFLDARRTTQRTVPTELHVRHERGAEAWCSRTTTSCRSSAVLIWSVNRDDQFLVPAVAPQLRRHLREVHRALQRRDAAHRRLAGQGLRRAAAQLGGSPADDLLQRAARLPAARRARPVAAGGRGHDLPPRPAVRLHGRRGASRHGVGLLRRQAHPGA
jgi:predicted CoA-substrate-specific enzyme activase